MRLYEIVYAREREREKGEEHVCVLNSIFKKQKTIKSSSFLLPTTHNNKNFIQKRKLRKSGEPCHGNNYKLRVSSKTNKLPVSGAHIINLTLAWQIPRLFTLRCRRAGQSHSILSSSVPTTLYPIGWKIIGMRLG